MLEVAIVGDAGGAIAKAELGANVELDLAAAIVGLAAERLSFAPGIGAKRPIGFRPYRADLADCRQALMSMLTTRNAA